MSQAENKVIPEGYKQTEVGVIPEDWLVSNLGSIGKFKNGINKGAESFGHGLPFINLMDVFGHTHIRGDEEFGLIDSNIIDRKEYNIKEGDVLFIRSSVKPSGVGLSSVIKTTLNNTVYSGFLIRYRSNESLNTAFKEYCFYNNSFRDCVIASSTVSANTNINQDALKDLLLSYPVNLKEQTAIANALSDVDALLSELEKLIAKKQAMKNATMQQLLTGKTRLPQFAFYSDINSTEGAVEGMRKHSSSTNVNVGACDDGSLVSQESGGMDSRRKGTKPSELGEIPEDWEVLPLGKMLKDIPKYGINAAAVPLQGSLPVYIRITDISEDGYFKPTELVGVNSPFSNDYQLETGDIVLARTGASVGKSYLYNESDGKLVYAGFLIKVSSNKGKLKPEYLFQYLKTEQYWSWVTVNSMRSGQPGINGNEYRQLPVPIPSIQEQTAIATILSDMDNEIQALEQRLSKTRQIKQGMMQELLTGKTRLPFGKDITSEVSV